jgi:hypothetical protein
VDLFVMFGTLVKPNKGQRRMASSVGQGAMSASELPPKYSDRENGELLQHSPPDLNAEEPPPSYTPLNESLHLFSVKIPFIYAAPKLNNLSADRLAPRYQLSCEYTRSGQPFILKIRRLLRSEIRSLEPLDNKVSSTRHVVFDDDTTIYYVENMAAKMAFSKGIGPIEIRGRQAGTLAGSIQFPSPGFRSSAKFWHISRNPHGDALKKHNEAKMQKYGYKPADEVNRDLCFSIRRDSKSQQTEWRSGKGQIIAVEHISGDLEIVDDTMLDRKARDILVTCWCARKWANGALSFE